MGAGSDAGLLLQSHRTCVGVHGARLCQDLLSRVWQLAAASDVLSSDGRRTAPCCGRAVRRASQQLLGEVVLASGKQDGLHPAAKPMHQQTADTGHTRPKPYIHTLHCIDMHTSGVN